MTERYKMKIKEMYSRIKTIKLTHSVITWCLLIMCMFTMIFKVNKLEKNVALLQNNETLILLQLESEEKDIKKVHTRVVDIDSLINKYSKQYGVDPSLAKAVAKVESGGKQNVVSNAGAIGVFQVMPSTAKAMGENPYTPEGNIKSGIKYLSYLDKKFNGDTTKVIASYNAGPNAVQKHNGVPPYKETQNYVQKVKAEKDKLDEINDRGIGEANSNTIVRVYKDTSPKDKK